MSSLTRSLTQPIRKNYPKHVRHQICTDNFHSENVIATTKKGDGNNIYVVGGHSDSVAPGPGINDDGSGIIALLELALQLTDFNVKNKVRFGFWSAEESGKIGSAFYVNNLPAAELAKIRLYNNFDMIASPNYVYGVYDGDGSAFNVSGPTGSAEAEQLFLDWYADQGLPSVPSAFTGRSDYEAFINNGIPASGLFTGAEQVKTAEEAVLFGGEAGVAYDINYHQAGDTVDNLNAVAFVTNTKLIAHTIGVYGRSWEGFPKRDTANAKRGISPVPKGRGAVLPVSRRSSKLRRGVPCAHTIYGTANTINCANYVFFLALEKCHQLQSKEAMDVFVLELLNLHRGQGQDILWREECRCPTGT